MSDSVTYVVDTPYFGESWIAKKANRVFERLHLEPFGIIESKKLQIRTDIDGSESIVYQYNIWVKKTKMERFEEGIFEPNRIVR